MIHRAFLIAVIVVITSSFQHKPNDLEDSKTIKIMTYNIWNGFDWGKDEARRDEFVTWVDFHKPDVLALQELCGYTQETLLREAKKWGHPYAEILKTSGYPVGITSNKPIQVKAKILDGMHHGALHCKTNGIDFFVIHFSPFSYKKRHLEAKTILEKLFQISKEQNKYIVLGDFNAVSPFDADLYKNKANLISTMKASEVEHDHVRNLCHGDLEYGVMGALLGYPLIDVTQRYTTGWDNRISCPTRVFETKKGDKPNENSKRIDYILASPFLAEKCINAKVLNQKETYYLSDHYPVLAEFEL
ncbi:endonuclease/exonuclease/phosphatase family protein [Flavivirga spongiicola]|uniref:Endonuclease/exonuclease/phosphatase family protein n=1 Tax=Flavivirga spongiicola TaxID=421621 RepID=A0ABU7XNS4_9FLAO|nr:endonuclease/exonuclease/phosphatase family protein [Flavivirga sp. MEBiC05379]MDO5977406.1 endonuclease/exonuclease/phosphatase family protein [Flavivirga sp. MEBiC05379]